MSKLNYSEIIRQIESLEMMPNRPPSLEIMKDALKDLFPKPPLDPFKVILVAGTNGKGSTCASLEALLLSANQKVGLYTSPHLENTTERFRINGLDISEDLFCEAYEQVLKKTSKHPLSHFEMLTLMAVWIFAKEALDWSLFEVGLGGTWDATNAIPHHYNIISSLSFDHRNILGNSLPEIASNKFGIIGPHSKVIYAELPDEVKSLAEQVAKNTQSHWIPSVPFQLTVQRKNNIPQFLLQTEWGEAELNLPGLRGAQNSAIALTFFKEIGFNPKDHLSALSKVRWPGRMELFQHPSFPAPIYLSGDHNPAGIQSLIEVLSHYPRNRLHILVGIGKDKDQEEILTQLFSLPSTSIYLTETPFRGFRLSEYGKWLKQAAGSDRSPEKAISLLKSKVQSEDLILVTGSLYLVGQIRHLLSHL